MLRTLSISAAALVLLAASGLRFRAYAVTPRSETRYLAIALAAFGLALLGNVAPIVRLLDRWVWHTNDATILLSQLLGLVTAWGGIELCTEVSGRGEHGRTVRRWALAASCTVLAALFLTSGRLVEAPLFFERYEHDGHLRAYWVALTVILIAATGYLCYIAHHHTRHEDRWLRAGLNLISVGAGLDTVFALSRLVAVWANLPAWTDSAAVATLIIGSCILALGAVLPQLADIQRRRRAQRELYPIWVAVTAAYPHVRRSDRPTTLYREIIEIQDAVAEARSHGTLQSALMQALDRLPHRGSDEVDTAIDDLLEIAEAFRLSA